MLPASISGASHEAPPFLFKAGPASVAMKEAEDRLTCKISGSVWLKKLTADQKSQKKRPKPADLAEEKAKKQKVAKAGGKSKAAPKAKSKPGSASLEAGESADTLQAEISFQVSLAEEVPSGSRPRMWLDDMIAALMAVMKNHAQSMKQDLCIDAHGSSPQARLLAMVVATGLRFALEGKVQVKKKVFKQWSQFRPALQAMLKQGLEQLSRTAMSTLPSASSVSDLLQNLVSEVGHEASTQLTSLTATETPQAAMQAAKAILQDKESMGIVEKFIEKNNNSSVLQHLAYNTMLSTIKDSLCSCRAPDSTTASSCGVHCDTHTVTDLFWGVHNSFKIVEQQQSSVLPSEVGVVGAASLVAAATTAHTVRNKLQALSPSSKGGENEMKDWILLGSDLALTCFALHWHSIPYSILKRINQAYWIDVRSR